MITRNQCQLLTTASFLGESSSSFNVEDLNDSGKATTLQQTRIVKTKKVMICEDLNQEYDDKLRCKEECHKTWYSDDQFVLFKSRTRNTVRKALKKQQEETENENTFFSTLTEIYQAVCKNPEKALSPAQEAKLIHAYCKNPLLMGLEYYVVQAITMDSKTRRNFIQDAVYELQCESMIVFDEGTSLADNKILDALSEELRDACENVTRSPAVFAQLLAQAQEMVV